MLHQHRKKISNVRFGFTLVEILVVIGILGILVGGIIVAVNPLDQIGKARDAKRKSDLSHIKQALETYYQDKGRYPPSEGLSCSTIGGSEGSEEVCFMASVYKIVRLDGTIAEWGSSFAPYLDKLPKDSDSAKTYRYHAPGGQLFYLFASLDRGGKDQDACDSGSACQNVPPGGVLCGTRQSDVCNYGVSSANTRP